jgi:hypothetical protein
MEMMRAMITAKAGRAPLEYKGPPPQQAPRGRATADGTDGNLLVPSATERLAQ